MTSFFCVVKSSFTRESLVARRISRFMTTEMAYSSTEVLQEHSKGLHAGAQSFRGAVIHPPPYFCILGFKKKILSVYLFVLAVVNFI